MTKKVIISCTEWYPVFDIEDYAEGDQLYGGHKLIELTEEQYKQITEAKQKFVEAQTILDTIWERS